MTKTAIEITLLIATIVGVVRLIQWIIVKKKTKQRQKQQRDLLTLMLNNATYLPCEFIGEIDGDKIVWSSYVLNKPNCRNLLCLCGARCCECVPFHQQRWLQVKKFIPKGKKYTLVPYDTYRKLVQPQTEDGKCVFLGEDRLCLIYDTGLRPRICRTFADVHAKTEEAAIAYSCPYLNPHLYDHGMVEGLESNKILPNYTTNQNHPPPIMFLPARE
jgi:hypothetical protein